MGNCKLKFAQFRIFSVNFGQNGFLKLTPVHRRKVGRSHVAGDIQGTNAAVGSLVGVDTLIELNFTTHKL
jgi:hypothetical protein